MARAFLCGGGCQPGTPQTPVHQEGPEATMALDFESLPQYIHKRFDLGHT